MCEIWDTVSVTYEDTQGTLVKTVFADAARRSYILRFLFVVLFTYFLLIKVLNKDASIKIREASWASWCVLTVDISTSAKHTKGYLHDSGAY